MPAIQPEQLHRQIDALLRLVDEPQAFIRSCMNLVDYYADRTKRPRGSAAKVEIARILRVPRPVMKALCLRIQQFEGATPEIWLEIGRGLWRQAIRETRQVAACVLPKVPQDVIAQEAEAWAIECEDDEALTYLASTGLKAWRNQDQDRFYASIETWLGDARVRIRHLAILALHARSEDDPFNELPRILSLLAGRAAEVRGSSQRSLTGLVRRLSRISSPEVAKFLMDEVEAEVQGARRLAQAALPAFPEKLQTEIQRVLG